MNPHLLLSSVVMLLSLAVFAAGPSEDGDQFSFTLNGESISPYSRTLKSMGIDRDEMLIWIEDLVILAEVEKSYALTGNLEKDGRLYREVDGEKRLIGLVAHTAYQKNGYKKVDPFAGLRAADLRHVRGVCLDLPPSKRALDLLRHVDPRMVVFRITDTGAVGNPKKLPALPPTAMFIEIDESSSNGIKDFSYLKSLNSLVYLRIHTLHGHPVDIHSIADNPNLLYLDLSGADLANIGDLGRLRGLRYLDLSHCATPTASDFLGTLSELRELHIRQTEIEDLTMLEHLTKIVRVNANRSRVKALPKKPVASLRRLSVIATPLTEAQVEVFQEHNPECQVQHGWTSTLRMALEGVDRMRVRSGGTCHRNPPEEKTLFEITDPHDLIETITNIVLEPSGSGFHCMCCGNPSLEFYREGKLDVTLGFHHGQSLRWMGGDWPGDALLSPASGDFLCELFAKHGIDRPLRERNEEKQREKAVEFRMAQYRNVLPEGVAQRLSEARSAAAALNAFNEGEMDKSKRVTLALRILGCHNGSWNQKSVLDPIALALLKNEVPSDILPGISTRGDLPNETKITTSDIIAALTANQQDTIVIRGAARWYLGESKLETLPVESVEGLLPLIVEAGLTHPRQINRRRTLYELEDLHSAAAIEELRKVIQGKFIVEPLKPEEAIEPGGMVEFTARDGQIDDQCSDRALAALLLAKMEDQKSLAEIRALLNSELEPESKKVLQQAVALLGKSR